MLSFLLRQCNRLRPARPRSGCRGPASAIERASTLPNQQPFVEAPWQVIHSSRTSCTARGARTRSGPAVHAAAARDPGGVQGGPARPGVQPAPARGDPGGQGRQHAQGQYRPGDQARPGRRRRELRRGPLRGLRPRRRRGDRRGADRQPQPHRELRALQLRQAWRRAGRDQQRQLPVQPGRPDPLPGGGGRCRRDAGGRDRGRRRGLRELRGRARDHLRRRTSWPPCRRSSRRASGRPSRRS